MRELASYVWQYYLLRLPFQNQNAPLGDYPQAYETWFMRAVAAFGWLEVWWSPAVYAGLLAVWLSLIGGAALRIYQRRRRLDWMLMAFFVTALLSLLAGLHWSEYRIAESSYNLLSQGRYLFPCSASKDPAVGPDHSPGALAVALSGAYVGGLSVLELCRCPGRRVRCSGRRCSHSRVLPIGLLGWCAVGPSTTARGIHHARGGNAGEADGR